MAERLEFKVLGPLEVWAKGGQLDLGAYKQRSLLALLLANVNQVVSIDRITDSLWGDEASDKEKTVWVYVSRLRSVLEPDRESRGESSVLITKEPGYLLAADPGQVDYLRFEEAVGDARTALENDPDQAREILERALALWRGEAFADFAYENFLRNDLDRLNELRLEAGELRFEAMLRDGQSSELVTDLEIVTRENPYREKPVRQLMVALYRSGRQAEALRVYERHRRTVVDELGIDPSPELRRIEEQILLHDPSLVPSGRATPNLLTAHGQANPFKGLHAFNEADETTFFGRDALVAELLRRIDQGDRLVAAVGPSGSGKSSAVRAGMIPRIRKLSTPGGDRWIVAQMVPGAHPFTELEAALLRARLDGPDSLTEQLAGGDTAILRAGLRVLPDSDSRLLLVIDQFEELFTLVEDREQQQRFLEALLTAIDDPHGRITVVLTLRADFYDRPLLHPKFGRRLGDAVVNVTPMSAAELEEAALRPAGVAGVSIEPRLLARLLATVVGEPGALPMFQYTLTELYERQEDGMLLESTYEKMGGLRGAITNRAEELYGELEPAEQAAARQLFLRLVAMSDEEKWSRRRVKASEILSLHVDVIALQTVIDRYGAHRLLFFDRDKVTGSPTVEVGHEALLYEWPRLAEWIIRARRDLLRHGALRTAIDEWEWSDRDPGYLLTGSRLAETEASSASGSIQLNSYEMEYLDASMAARSDQQLAEDKRQASEAKLAGSARRRLWALVAVVCLVAVVGAAAVITAGGAGPRAVFIHAGDSIASDLTIAGLAEAERLYGVEFDIIAPPFAASVPDLVRAQIESGSDLILTDWALWEGTGDEQYAIAEASPDTKFVMFNSFAHPTPINYLGLLFEESESAYLAGVAAALESKTGRVGVIGAFPVNIVDDRIAGFISGAKSIDPSIDVQYEYLGFQPTGDLIPGESDELFHRPDLGRDLAFEMYSQGVDVLYHAAGDSGLGIFEAALEHTRVSGNHVWGIGGGSDQFFDVPEEQQAHVLMSTVRRYDKAALRAAMMVADGTFDHNNRVASLDNGGVDIVTTGNHLAANTTAAIEAGRADVINRTAEFEFLLDDRMRPEVVPCGPDESGYQLVAGCRLLSVAFPLFPSLPFREAVESSEGSETVIGFEPEILIEIARRLNLDVQFMPDPFLHLISDVSIGRYDMAFGRLDITEQRSRAVSFSEPYLRNPAILIVAEGSNIETMEDVETVVVGLGSSFDDLVSTRFPDKTVVYGNEFERAGLVTSGEADGWVFEMFDGLEGDPTLKIASVVEDDFFTAFPVNPRLSALKTDVDRALAAMIEDGTYAQIYERWFGNDLLRVDRP